jgi:hypothetical protein
LSREEITRQPKPGNETLCRGSATEDENQSRNTVAHTDRMSRMNSQLRDPSRKGLMDPTMRALGAQAAGVAHTHTRLK